MLTLIEYFIATCAIIFMVVALSIRKKIKKLKYSGRLVEIHRLHQTNMLLFIGTFFAVMAFVLIEVFK